MIFAEGMKNNLGPWNLYLYSMNPFEFSGQQAFASFAEALQMNTYLHGPWLYRLTFYSEDQEELFFSAIQRNKGLRCLGFGGHETLPTRSWELLCNSVQKHSSIVKLDLSGCRHSQEEELPCLRKLVSALSTNTVITQVTLGNLFVPQSEQIAQQSLEPILEYNKHHPHVEALLHLPDDGEKRTKLLGRAMTKFCHNPRLLYPLLQGSLSTWEKHYCGTMRTQKRKRE